MKTLHARFALLLQALLPAAWLSLAFAASGCMSGDPYSSVVAVCNFPVPGLGEIALTDDDKNKTYLTPECKSALEAVIPYDDASFATAPTGMKDKVTEGFQAIIAYPIALPDENKLFGVSPALAGAIPLDFYRIYQQDANPNQSLFNYILNHTDTVQYGGDGGNVDAQYNPALSTHPRQITIYKNFWRPDALEGMFRTPFIRASTLAHEARHGDGIFHALCDYTKSDGNSGLACDNDLLGAYGFGITYLHALLKGGSATCSTPGCTPALPPIEVMIIGWEMCTDLKGHFNRRFKEVEDVIRDVDCSSLVDYDWAMQHEGVSEPPAASPSTTPSTTPTPSPPATPSPTYTPSVHGPGLGIQCTSTGK